MTTCQVMCYDFLSMNEETIRSFLEDIRGSTRQDELNAIKQWSMLHWEVLAVMDLFARTAPGRVVEIGAFIGGSTTVLARAATAPILTIEKGGTHHRDHPYLPTPDILAALHTNLAREGVAERVIVIEGRSWEASVLERVGRLLNGDRIGLLAIDADGDIERDIKNLAPHLAPRCLLVIDDYVAVTPGAAFKAARTKPAIDALAARGALEAFGVYGWGTWTGCLTGPVE